MQSAQVLFVLGVGISAAQSALAQDVRDWIGAPDCRLAAVEPAPAQAPTWRGGCKDGYADGKGVLEWRSGEGKAYRLAASFSAGQVAGEGELRYPTGTVYTGTLRNGVPDGHGYYVYPDGGQYEGELRMGRRNGIGEMIYPSGTDYKGQWKDGKPDGTGTVTYMLGGRYEGGWKDGKPSGQGKLVYAGIPERAVAVVDGQDPARPPKPVVDKTYQVREDYADLGTLFRRDLARSIPVPPALGYKQLSAEQQAMVDSWYPVLAPGDEPPYPLNGPAEFYKFMSRVVSRTREVGTVRVYVVVGKDGRPVSARAVGLDDPAVRKLILTGAATLRYKPALCAGQPCEMAYPFNMALTLGR